MGIGEPSAELPAPPAWWLGLGLPVDEKTAAKVLERRREYWAAMPPEHHAFILSAVEPSPPQKTGR